MTEHYTKKVCIGTSILLVMLWFPFVGLGEDVNVIKTTDSELKQTSYSALAGDQQEIKLITYQTDINQAFLDT